MRRVRRGDDPRWRGGDRQWYGRNGHPTGRSPLARGRPTSRALLPAPARTIPAGAGETQRGRGGGDLLRDDPRWRGGDLRSEPNPEMSSGRSPLARGRPMSQCPVFDPFRTIPAGAGETWRWWTITASSTDDPRWRGGDPSESADFLEAVGRSPLARGRLATLNAPSGSDRTIPACAGETGRASRSTARRRDDPRWRGGDATHVDGPQVQSGRSPLARGRLGQSRLALRSQRTIPAGAEETAACPVLMPHSEDDPRWRGGDTDRLSAQTSPGGRSPLARGRLTGSREGAGLLRTIPAGAGETTGDTLPQPTRGDDPRWRGGDSMACSTSRFTSGRSPLARGRHEWCVDGPGGNGTIPAGAGETTVTIRQAIATADDPRWRGGDGKAYRRLDQIPRTIPAGAGETLRQIVAEKV